MKLTLHATEFAARAHAGQERKYTGHPYIWHPINVAVKLSQYTDDQEMLAAAILHDTIEDTDVTYKDIKRRFGPRVADLVQALTNPSKSEDGNRALRKKMDKDYMAEQCADAKTIRLADTFDNLKDVMVSDPNFARVYVREKRDLMTVLTDGHLELYRDVEELIKNYYLERNQIEEVVEND